MLTNVFLFPLLMAITRAMHCAFIHGAGQFGSYTDDKSSALPEDKWGAYSANTQDFTEGATRVALTPDPGLEICNKSPIEKWGLSSSDKDERLSHCKTVTFFMADTTNAAWSDPRLWPIACKAANPLATGDEITNTIIFTYSMGGLTLMKALQMGICKIGANVKWISMGVPWDGTPLADWSETLCKGIGSQKFCKPDGKPREPVEQLKRENIPVDMVNAYKDKITASVCSMGIGDEGPDTGAKVLSATTTFHNSLTWYYGNRPYSTEHDGKVPTSSCELISPNGFTKEPLTSDGKFNPFYEVNASHRWINGRKEDTKQCKIRQWVRAVLADVAAQNIESGLSDTTFADEEERVATKVISHTGESANSNLNIQNPRFLVGTFDFVLIATGCMIGCFLRELTLSFGASSSLSSYSTLLEAEV